MALLLLPIVLILYVAAAGAFIAYLVSARERLRELAPLLLAAAAALHGFEIAGRSFAIGHIAVTSFDEGLSFLAFSLAILYLLLDRRHVLAVLGAVIPPPASALMAVSVLGLSGATGLPPAPPRGLRAAALTIFGFAVLLVSFVSVNVFFPGRHGGSFGS